VKVLVICARRYNGHELWTALGIMQEAGIEFEVISTANVIADEITFQSNTIERTIDDVEPSEIDSFDGLMIVSGNMADTELYWKHPKVLAYVDEANRLNKQIAAICCSVPTVRAAAKDKTVSFYPLVRSRDLLTLAGATLSNISISSDGNLVTAEHQMATQTWAEAFVAKLKGEDPELTLRDSGFKPTGKTRRKLHPRLEALRSDADQYK